MATRLSQITGPKWTADWRSLISHSALIIALVTLTACGAPLSSALPDATRFAVLPVPATHGPPACHTLANSRALRQLPAALERLPDPSQRLYVNEVVSAAAADIRSAASTANGNLAAKLAKAGRALSDLQASRSINKSLITSVESAMEAFGQGIQTTCSFPVG